LKRLPARQLFLLDGTYELFRAYFALPAEQSPDGREIGAIRGLVASVLKLLRQPEVTHVAAATDHVIESFRNQMFAGYKTGEGLPEDLASQFHLAEDALRAMGVVVWPMIEFEADDALAAAANQFASQVDRVVILSADKDLAQCVVGQNVVLHDRLRNKTYDEAGVHTKFGVPPASIADYLALVGDSADGIPGLSGWGAKSAASLLNVYGSIETIPDDPDRWSVDVRRRNHLAGTLAKNRSEAKLYKELATLRLDVPFSESLEDLRYCGTPRTRYQSFCRDVGLGGLSERPAQWASE
jgi:5'-3' exonuclease